MVKTRLLHIASLASYTILIGNIEISEKKKRVEDLGHDVRHGYIKIIAAVRLGGLAPAL